MGRPVYPHELVDPDFTWLITNYRENHPQSVPVESTCLPVVFITEDLPDSESTVLPENTVSGIEDITEKDRP